MSDPSETGPHVTRVRPVLRRLSDRVVDQIAAGEVVERPAAALKELMENALDAGATRIEVRLQNGGIDSIEVTDNGCGLGPEELPLAVERHCTSKLQDETLVHIRTLGFRGEALPSIGATARLSLISRVPGSETAWQYRVEGGLPHGPAPAAGPEGTQVTVRDIFFATPARRKFLKSARVEGGHAEMVVRRLALSAPDCAFLFLMDGREVFNLPPQDQRTRSAAILGVPAEVLIALEERRVTGAGGSDAEMRLTGFIAGPAHSRATGAGQFLLVNGRPVTDPVLRTAVRVAYRPVLERGRFPLLLLHLHVPFARVDVNVHPAKTELRFADEAEVRAFVIGALNRALARGAGGEGGIHARLTAARPLGAPVGPQSLSAHHQNTSSALPSEEDRQDFGFAPSLRHYPLPSEAPSELAETTRAFTQPTGLQALEEAAAVFGDAPSPEGEYASVRPVNQPLGVPIAQIHSTYILSVAPDGDLILTDQHAAHERLTHEKLRVRMEREGHLRAQALLIPAVVDLTGSEAAALLENRGELAELGVEIEAFGGGSILVRSVPALLKGGNVEGLLRDVADELAQTPNLPARQTEILDRRIESVLARMACHGSIRAGRRMTQEEMAALLRDMEQNPRANTCSHGRPTWVKLTRHELEKLFGRL